MIMHGTMNVKIAVVMRAYQTVVAVTPLSLDYRSWTQFYSESMGNNSWPPLGVTDRLEI
jgi:hypothetical protein